MFDNSISLKVSEDTEQDIEDNVPEDTSKSEFVREAIQDKINEQKLSDIESKIEDIKLRAKKESYKRMSDTFEVNSGVAYTTSNNEEHSNQLNLEENYPGPQHYTDKIEEQKEDLKQVKNKLTTLQEYRDRVLLERAINSGNAGSKEQLKNLKTQLEQLAERKDKLEGTIDQLRSFKEEVREKHQKREQLEQFLTAKYIREELLEDLKDILQHDYENFRDSYNELRRVFDIYSSYRGKASDRSTSGRFNTNNLEVLLREDLGIDTPGIKSPNIDYKNSKFSDLVRIPNLPSEPDLEGD